MGGYTVVDVETTGLVPEKHDRIVEIGVVYVSHDGHIQDRWSTLINPQRDVGPTRVHGITAKDVATAPTFAEIAPYVVRALAGRIAVAHNASFDLRFIAHELLRVGVPLSTLPLRGLCTMAWAPAYLELRSRRLGDCCSACGIVLDQAHCAGSDAYATAQLLAHYLRAAQFRPPWQNTLSDARAYPWPSYDGAYPEWRMVHRGKVAAARDDAWLDSIVARMPRAADPRVDGYLAVLEMALIDGFLAEHEKDQLIEVAAAVGLTRGQVLDLHADYLAALAEAALEDGVVTTDERLELLNVASMLGLCPGDVDAALDAGTASTMSAPAVARTAVEAAGIILETGDRVVFTGDMRRDRSEWIRLARAHGLEPGGVTKSTKIVIAADPNSMSGKAAKARTYGVPIITEDAFERLLNGHIDAGRLP